MLSRIVLMAVVIAAASCSAAATTPLREYPWLRVGANLGDMQGLSMEAMPPSAERLATLKSEGHGFVDLLLRVDLHLHADGHTSETITQVRRFLSSAGVDQGGNMGFPVAPEFETATIERALVIGPEGTAVVNPSNLQVVPRHEPRVFTDVREVVVPFPGIRPGSTAVLSVVSRYEPPAFLRPWSTGLMLRGMVPIESFEMTASWDAGVRNPRWASSDPALRCVADGERRIACTQRHVPALPTDPDMDSAFDLVPQLYFSQVNDWNELVRNITSVVERQVASGDVREVAKRLTVGKATPRARLDAIYRFVADEIRYVGLEQGSGAVVPRPPEVTLQNRFGDCKDKVVLFIALARAAGLTASAVLTSVYRHDIEKLSLPSSLYFNHMIACVADLDGGEVCVDPTLSNVPADELGGALQGAVALDLRNETTAPRQLPSTRFGLVIAVNSTSRVACDGEINEFSRRTFSGSGAVPLRYGLDARRPDERVRWLEDEYRVAVNSEARPTFTIAGLDTATAPLVVESTARIAGTRSLQDSEGFEDADGWLMVYGMALRTENRHHPYRHGGLRYTSTVRITLCPEVVARYMGAELDLRSPFGSLTRRYDASNSEVAVHTTLEVPAGTISNEQVPRFNRFIEQSLLQSGIWFSLAPSS